MLSTATSNANWTSAKAGWDDLRAIRTAVLSRRQTGLTHSSLPGSEDSQLWLQVNSSHMTIQNRTSRPISSFLRSVSISLALAAVALTSLHSDEGVQYPDGFRRWVHIGTGVIMPGTNPQLKSEEGMHHVFANPKASDAYSKGDFPDGSVIVYELREARQSNGVITEGERRRVDVMIKNSALYKSTGGWRFERFFGDQQTENAIQDSGTSCFGCHSKAEQHGFVFSKLR